MNDPLSDLLATIDGALADPEIPDGMRWTPRPDEADDGWAMIFDGDTVPQPIQYYEADDLRGAIERTQHIVPASPDERALRFRRSPLSLRVSVIQPDPEALARAVQAFDGIATALAPAAAAFGDAITRAAESMGAAMRAHPDEIARLLAVARDLEPLQQPSDPRPADPRQRALHARRTAGTGPPLLGPERSHAPRRIR